MNPSFKPARALSAHLVALCAALLLPMAHAQAPANPGAQPMQGSKGHAASMSGGSMDMKDMKGMDMKGMDMQAMMKDNNDKMSGMQMTGKPDVDFALMMRIHHQGAIDMAQAQLRDGKAPEMRKMARDIIAAQKKEIGQLDRFLAKSGHPVDKTVK